MACLVEANEIRFFTKKRVVMLICFHPDAEGSSELKPLIYELVAYACDQTGFDIEKLTSIHIADTESYPQVVSSLCPGELCSSNQYYVGVGKSISIFEENRREHHLIYKMSVVCRVASYIGKKRQTKEIYEYMAMEIFVHEFGHLVDNEARGIGSSAQSLDTGVFSIDKMAEYYLDMLFSEFFACFHSSMVMSKELYIEQNNEDNLNFERMLTELDELKSKFRNDTESLARIAFHSSQFFWMILIQYSKLMAASLGNKNLKAMDVKFFSGCPKSMQNVVDGLHSNLSLLVGQYPHIPKTIAGNLIEIWYNIAFIFRFFFTTGVEGDAVRFD